jgi:hypothetical protein
MIWLPKYNGSLRSMMAEGHGSEYIAFKSLEEARSRSNSVVIMQGDDGGTIYLTIPVRNVSCGQATLNQLLADIDAMCWADPSMARVFYEIVPSAGAVAGGMGGGRIVDGLWLHLEVEKLGVRQDVEDVLRGERARMEITGKRWS